MFSSSWLLGFIGKLDHSMGGVDESNLNEQEKEVLRSARREWHFYNPSEAKLYPSTERHIPEKRKAGGK